jgi:hypothetical protein
MIRMTAIPWSWRGRPDLNQHQGLTTAIAIALAVIITAGGMSLVGSYVLCVGSDGHADLELAFGMCCIDDDGPRADSDTSTKLVDSCGRCADIELDGSSLTKGKRRLAPPRCAVMDVAGQFSTNAESMLDTGRGAESGPPHFGNRVKVVLLT